MSTTNQPPQPPKQAAYDEPNNPVTHNPVEQRASTLQNQSQGHSGRRYGDAVPSIVRGAGSQPSNASALSEVQRRREREHAAMQNAPDVDLEYGVEQQPNEGDIAAAVESKGTRREQAGAHAGAVGSMPGPGYTKYGEKGLMSDMERKREEHDRVLGERIGHSPPEPDVETAERETLRQRKLEEARRLDAKAAVQEATGDRVVG
ncbi:hypothetical protein P170DRAFT_425271 [Aspergillus steynii IBT 23096]|uniref:Uncharacterized protein n=1 Tax=Aspergillus steynii IBT 23096 TaxID=1392250 RepID=A0A2I2GDL1_9EURO|nr:uncharacterized protein P170DRAFT_425271 [Aspergillus steynii IBT 23096]PLB50978.1 hypothetical protein P170DRAFT_425271 [Aspergillus steynii IBT 23096]